MRANLGSLAAVGLVLGGCGTWAMSLGYLRTSSKAVDDALFVTLGLLFLVSGGGLAIVAGFEWFQERFPSTGRRAYYAQVAQLLGLRPVQEAATVGRTFPLLGATRTPSAGLWHGIRLVLSLCAFIAWLLITLIYGMIATVGALDLPTFALIFGAASVVFLGAGWMLGDWSKWFRSTFGKQEPGTRPGQFATGALRPGPGRISHVFAGRWQDLDVQVFDYTHGEDPATEWTCALLPLPSPVPDLEVRSVSFGTRLERAFGQRGLSFGDEEFERAFRVLADDDVAARRVLTPSVRALIARDAPGRRFILQLHGKQMLYCGFRTDTQSRGSLLEGAGRLRDSLSQR